MKFYEKDKLKALQAKHQAQIIAFGPAVFQSARSLRNLGILDHLEKSKSHGITLAELVAATGISEYGVRVLIEAGLGLGMVLEREGRYLLGKVGYFLLHDPLTITNMDFMHDVCYEGLFHLQESIETGKPVGLKVFGDRWPTVYDALSSLPPQVQKSWFAFDHFFSDDAFPLVLERVVGKNPIKLLDIGGNTGKWSMMAARYNPQAKLTIMDLPGQAAMARKNVEDAGLQEQIDFYPGSVLKDETVFPTGYDVVWMSQFLDCFSEEEITGILRRASASLKPDGRIIIMEPFWDLQYFETAALCLQQTSLYFTAIANGNSQMYDSRVFMKCVENAGLLLVEQTDMIGLSQTLLELKLP